MQNITYSTYILSPCPEYGGEGDFANESSTTRCPTCNGYGQVKLHQGSHEIEFARNEREKVER